jgi:DDE superfamily endonuclease
MSTKRSIQYWVIPPEANAEFVAHMEDVLDVYSRPYDPNVPVLCMDEQPVQRVEEVRSPIAATKAHAKRIDYEYKRAGVANIFMFAEPLAQWRQVSVREKKTKVDWASEMAALLEGRYAGCEKVLVVCDNLNTHTKGAFYETFEPGRARSLVSRIEFHYTPKHGSWLNIAENELSSMTRQCVAGRRFGTTAELEDETTAWHEDVNNAQRGVDWQMKIDDARTKLQSVYPKIKM